MIYNEIISQQCYSMPPCAGCPCTPCMPLGWSLDQSIDLSGILPLGGQNQYSHSPSWWRHRPDKPSISANERWLHHQYPTTTTVMNTSSVGESSTKLAGSVAFSKQVASASFPQTSGAATPVHPLIHRSVTGH